MGNKDVFARGIKVRRRPCKRCVGRLRARYGERRSVHSRILDETHQRYLEYLYFRGGYGKDLRAGPTDDGTYRKTVKFGWNFIGMTTLVKRIKKI